MEVRPLGPDDDLEAELDLRRRAFGPISAGRLPSWTKGLQASIEQGALFGAFDGGRLVGSARYHLMRQWWHGRSMPMAGVAGVKVAPEERGRGVGTAMMAALLEDIGSRGYPVSVLFPTHCAAVPGGGLGDRRPPLRDRAAGRVRWRRSRPRAIPPPQATTARQRRAEAAPGDAGRRRGDRRGRGHWRTSSCCTAGPNTREPWMLHDWLDDEDHFAYLADDGFLSYRWSADMEEIEVEELSPRPPRRLARSGRSWPRTPTMASRIRACLAPDDPVTWLTRDPAAELRQADTWMLRLVDAPAAIAARGYPAAATVSVAARYRRRRPARQLRPLGAGGVRRRGQPAAASGDTPDRGAERRPGGAQPRRPRLRGPLRRRPAPYAAAGRPGRRRRRSR